MFEFLYYQIQEQQRPVGFYPETSYWVNYDNEVSNSFAESRQSLTRSTVVKVSLAHLSAGPAVPPGVRVSTASRPSRHCSPRGTLSQARPTFGLGQIAYTCSVVHPFLRCPLIQIALGAKMDGQNVFDSGWEWGYWLQDVIAARAVWNPYMPRDSEMPLLRNALR